MTTGTDEYQAGRATDSEGNVIDAALGSIRTFTGLYVRPLELRIQDINIVDIAHSLSRQCRYNGHVAGFLSVAEHCVEVGRTVVEMGYPEYEFTALLHDAYEAYSGDIVRPLKHLPVMAWFREAEHRNEAVIHQALGGIFPRPPEVKEADRLRLGFEMVHLRDNPVEHMAPDEAKKLFLAAFARLTS